MTGCGTKRQFSGAAVEACDVFCLVPVQVSFSEPSMGCVISLPIRLGGHDHLMAELLCGLSGKLHFLMRAVSSITLTCSRAVT